jgi:hypothetical protein
VNPNRRTLAALVLSLFVLSGLGAETVIDQLYGARNYDLADAYWAAGQKFADLGQADRAAEFKAKAQRLFPGYVPGQSPVKAAPTVPVAAPALPSIAAVTEKNLQGERIARLQFQKLLRGYLTRSASTVASVLGDKLEVQGRTGDPSLAAVKAFLEAHPAEAGSPEELFDLDSLSAADAGQSVIVTVKALSDAPGDVATFPFWGASQSYTFDRVADTWKLVKIEGK